MLLWKSTDLLISRLQRPLHFHESEAVIPLTFGPIYPHGRGLPFQSQDFIGTSYLSRVCEVPFNHCTNVGELVLNVLVCPCILSSSGQERRKPGPSGIHVFRLCPHLQRSDSGPGATSLLLGPESRLCHL